MHPLFVLAVLLVPALAAAVPPAPDFAAAQALFDARKLAESQQAFERLAAADPKNPEVNYYLGQLALRRDDAAKAVSYLEKSTAAAPDIGRYHQALGDANGRSAQKAGLLSKLGYAKKCLAAYERAVALEPGNLDFRQSLFEFYRQAPPMAGGGLDKAAAQAAALKEINPVRGRIAYATLYAGEKKYDEALAQFDEVLRTNPDDYAALYQVGRLAALTGQFLDRGIVSLRRCLELPVPTAAGTPGRAATHWRLGQLLEKKFDPAGARAAYEAAVQLDPKFSPAVDALKKLK